MRKNFFPLRVTEPWPRLPREAVESPSLEILKKWEGRPCSVLRGWDSRVVAATPLSSAELRCSVDPELVGLCWGLNNTQSRGTPPELLAEVLQLWLAVVSWQGAVLCARLMHGTVQTHTLARSNCRELRQGSSLLPPQINP